MFRAKIWPPSPIVQKVQIFNCSLGQLHFGSGSNQSIKGRLRSRSAGTLYCILDVYRPNHDCILYSVYIYRYGRMEPCTLLEKPCHIDKSVHQALYLLG